MKKIYSFLLVSVFFGWLLISCQAKILTEQFIRREGPTLQFGRMAASLGAVKLPDGRVVVIGGSPTETPFKAITGTNAIEILDSGWQAWKTAGIDLKYPISGQAFLLKDGRIFVYSATYPFDPIVDEEPSDPKASPSGLVAAVIIDINNKTVIPLYRPRHNDPKLGPIKTGSPTIMQRAFARSLQLSDGRIIRIGGRALYLPPQRKTTCIIPPEKKHSQAKYCRYCYQSQCLPHPKKDFACESVQDCPPAKFRPKKTYFSTIEVYIPPGHPLAQSAPLGIVKYAYMNERRRHTAAVELDDGRVFITGGQGPHGVGERPDGAYGTYDTTYFFDPNTMKLTQGPRMIIGREDHAMVKLDDGRILITGGTDGYGHTLRRTEIFDPKTGIFYDAQPMNYSREDHLPARLGKFILFLGGEVSSKEDQIRNSAEVFYAAHGGFVGSFFLFSRNNTLWNEKLCPYKKAKGFAGIDDFALVSLDKTHILLIGGQQGCQDRDGEYISPGAGSRRTLIIELPSP